MPELPIDVWSDIVCPWCYIGKRRLESALARFPHAADVRVTWRAFELDPSAPKVSLTGESQAERLAKKYGRSLREAEGMIENVANVARGEGLEFDHAHARHSNTFDAHRLVYLAAQHGLGGAMKERLMRAHHCEGEAIGDASTLVRLGTEVGLDSDSVSALLASDDFAKAVRDDEQLAHELGITGVPCFVIARRFGVSGAQPADVLLGALERAWSELPPV